MKMRAPVLAMVICGLAACGPRVPESGPGPGFEDYNSYLRNRTNNPYATAPVAPVVPAAQPTAPAFSTDLAASAIAASEGGTTLSVRADDGAAA